MATSPTAAWIESGENSIAVLLEPYLEKEEGTKQKALSETDVRHITTCLQRMGKESWSRVPRVYTVLRSINQVHVLDAFIDLGIKDIWFPFSAKTLPDCLRSASAREKFLELQEIVLTSAVSLEREDGEHRRFIKEDDVPMKRVGILGRGGFGFVDRVVSTITHQEYARKLLPRGKTFKKDIQVLKDFEKELNNLKNLSHQHIVKLIGSYTDPKYVGILMSPVADYDLKAYLALEHNSASLSFLRTFFGCLAAALCYLHDRRLRHKDIKPQNVLVKGDRVFLTDFGLALDWTDSGQSTTSGITIKTPRYCAPEVAIGVSRNSSSDIWSLGCVYLEIWTVLKGDSVDRLNKYIEQHGVMPTNYHLNHDAIASWCADLKTKPKTQQENLPLQWITNMLQVEQDDRCSVQTLCGQIQEADEGEGNLMFSGPCCMNDDASIESAFASKRSSQFLEDTNTPSIGVYHGKLSEDHSIVSDTSQSSNSQTVKPHISSTWTHALDKIVTMTHEHNEQLPPSTNNRSGSLLSQEVHNAEESSNSKSEDFVPPQQATEAINASRNFLGQEHVVENQDLNELLGADSPESTLYRTLSPVGMDTAERPIGSLSMSMDDNQTIMNSQEKSIDSSIEASKPRQHTWTMDEHITDDPEVQRWMEDYTASIEKEQLSGSEINTVASDDMDAQKHTFSGYSPALDVISPKTEDSKPIRSTTWNGTELPVGSQTYSQHYPLRAQTQTGGSHQPRNEPEQIRLPEAVDYQPIMAESPKMSVSMLPPDLGSGFPELPDLWTLPDNATKTEPQSSHSPGPGVHHDVIPADWRPTPLVDNRHNSAPVGNSELLGELEIDPHKSDNTKILAPLEFDGHSSPADRVDNREVSSWRFETEEERLGLVRGISQASLAPSSISETDHTTPRQAMKKETSELCGKCGDLIHDRRVRVRALGKCFHIECFQCNDCGELVASKFFPVQDENQGQITLCEKDYFRRLDLLCFACGQALRGDYITACGRKYHEEHFKCFLCPQIFSRNTTYYVHKNEVHCRYDYSRVSETCKCCKRAILNEFVEKSERGRKYQWHNECYRLDSQYKFVPNLPSIVFVNDPSFQERVALEEGEEAREARFSFLATTILNFDEITASFIYGLFSNLSSREFFDSLRSSFGFVTQIQILFRAIDALNNHVPVADYFDLGYQRDAKLLCRKLILLFELTNERVVATFRIQDLCLNITQLASAVRSLIEHALEAISKTGYLSRTEQEQSPFLETLTDVQSISSEMTKEDIAKLADVSSDMCTRCSNPIEANCLVLNQTRWHLDCLYCTKCNKTPSNNQELCLPGDGSIQCHDCAAFSGHSRRHFQKVKSVSRLEQYVYLLKVGLARLTLSIGWEGNVEIERPKLSVTKEWIKKTLQTSHYVLYLSGISSILANLNESELQNLTNNESVSTGNEGTDNADTSRQDRDSHDHSIARKALPQVQSTYFALDSAKYAARHRMRMHKLLFSRRESATQPGDEQHEQSQDSRSTRTDTRVPQRFSPGDLPEQEKALSQSTSNDTYLRSNSDDTPLRTDPSSGTFASGEPAAKVRSESPFSSRPESDSSFRPGQEPEESSKVSTWFKRVAGAGKRAGQQFKYGYTDTE